MIAATLGLAAAFAAGASASTFPACNEALPAQAVTLVHVTDLHANYNPGPDGASPYARIRGYFESVKKTNPFTLLLNSGDDHEKGSVLDPLSKGQATRDLTREMRFDVRTLGNHDFAWGEPGVLDHARDPYAAVLASNVHYVGRDPLGFSATDYAEIRVGCVTLGFVGPISKPWNADDEPYAGHYPGFRARYDYAAQIRRVLKKRKNADAIVVLSHLGREDDLILARQVKGIDLILGGHTHGLTWEAIPVGRTQVVESGYAAKYLSREELTFDPATRRLTSLTHKLMRVDDDMPVNARIQAAVERERERWEPEAEVSPACACQDADAPRAAQVAASAALAELKADAAFIDKKTVWTPWKAGVLSAQQFLDAYKIERQPPGSPGFSSFYTVRVDGRILAELIRGADAARWAYRGPSAPRADRRYLVALPKRAALSPRSQLGAHAPFVRPRPAGELFEIVDGYARRRRAAGLCVDDGCTAK